MPKITPFLWFEKEAEEAANFYVSIFKDSKILSVNRFEGPDELGTVVTVAFEIEGQQVTALNGGPDHKLSEAFSFIVDCQSQGEVDKLWAELTVGGGEEGPCGWLKDRFGLSWQICPSVLIEMLHDEDPAKAGRVMNAMLQMKKIDIAALQEAYDG